MKRQLNFSANGTITARFEKENQPQTYNISMTVQPNGSKSSVRVSVRNGATWTVSYYQTIEYTLYTKSGSFVEGGSYNEEVTLSPRESKEFIYTVPDPYNQVYKIARGRINRIDPSSHDGNTVIADIINGF